MVLAAVLVAASQSTFNVRDYGAVGDGRTMCTKAIQQAIDAASSSKGTVFVPPGNYLTGTLHLRSNFTLKLDPSATILGSTNRNDYDHTFWYAVIAGEDVKNVTITGGGKIDGQGAALAKDVIHKVDTGEIKLARKSWRPPEQERPEIIEIQRGSNIRFQNVTIANAACWVQQYRSCVGLDLLGLKVRSYTYWNNDGIDVVDCHKVHIANCDIDSADDGICLKSDDHADACEDILIEHCKVRSSASAVKFGTSSHGGFKNIQVRDIQVRNTYRSAVTLEAVDGGDLSNVVVDRVRAVNTGNAFCIRLGHRDGKDVGRVDHVVLRDFDVQIPSGSPDAGYPFQGPPNSESENIEPASILGLPGYNVKDVTLENIRIRIAGGISPRVPKRTIDDLGKIPERPSDYPEFSMLGELPSWALYARHVEGLKVRNFQATIDGPDYRPPFVLDDVSDVQMAETSLKGSAAKSEIVLRNVKRYQLPTDLAVRRVDR